MKKILSSLKKNIYFWALAVLIIPSFISLVRPGFFTMHDDLQAFRVLEMDECIKDFQIPCRWVPNSGYQYGYPLFNYYPPSVYYLGEFFHLLGFQFINSAKLLFIFGFITAGFSMYLLLKSWLGKWPALVGALMYVYAPYRAVDVYVRGAMSEYWALTFFPLIFWSSRQLILTNKLRYLVYFALSTGLLLLTHNLMPLTFLPLGVIWALYWIIAERKWKSVLSLISGGLLAVGMAAFFSLPVVFEGKYAHIESIIGGYFDYRMHFVSLNQLFISNYWGFGSSVWGTGDEMSLSTGQLHALVGFLTIILGLAFYKKDKKLSILTLILGATALGVLFMIHQKSSEIWSLMPFLAYLQFPWRFLGDSIFLLSVLGGILIYMSGKYDFKISGIKASSLLGVLIIIGLFVFYGALFQPRTWLNISDEDKFTGKAWEKQLTISIFDYLPIYAKLPPIQKAPDKPEVLEGKANFTSYYKGSNWQTGQVNISEEAVLRLPLFDFPGMKVWSNGKEIDHWHDDCRGQEFCLGLITFKLSPGQYNIETKLTDTPVRTIGNTISLISVILLGGLFYMSFKRKRTL